MKPSNSCAVCGFQNIDSHQAKCPQCDADLTCFKVLDKIPDEPFPDKIKPRRASRLEIYLAITITGCILIMGVIFYSFRQLQTKVVRLQTAVNSYQTSKLIQATDSFQKNLFPPTGAQASQKGVGKNQKKQPPTTLDRDQPSKEQKKRKKFGRYRVERENSLWSIAKKIYGDGYYYPVILEHNPGLGVFNIKANQRIRILNDTSRIKKIYDSIVEREENAIIWQYRIQAEDDLYSVAKKFYNDEEMIDQLYYDNPNSGFQPGEKIKITFE